MSAVGGGTTGAGNTKATSTENPAQQTDQGAQAPKIANTGGKTLAHANLSLHLEADSTVSARSRSSSFTSPHLESHTSAAVTGLVANPNWSMEPAAVLQKFLAAPNEDRVMPENQFIMTENQVTTRRILDDHQVGPLPNDELIPVAEEDTTLEGLDPAPTPMGPNSGDMTTHYLRATADLALQNSLHPESTTYAPAADKLLADHNSGDTEVTKILSEYKIGNDRLIDRMPFDRLIQKADEGDPDAMWTLFKAQRNETNFHGATPKPAEYYSAELRKLARVHGDEVREGAKQPVKQPVKPGEQDNNYSQVQQKKVDDYASGPRRAFDVLWGAALGKPAALGEPEKPPDADAKVILKNAGFFGMDEE